MDSVTHMVAGMLLPVAYPKAPKRTSLIVFGAAAANIPDIDTFFSHGTPEGFMLIHRALTHSIFLQPFLMLALVFPFFIYMSCRTEYKKIPPGLPEKLGIKKPSLPQPSFFMLCAIALISQYIHVYLDCVTTFGTQAFLPISDFRIALPALFIVDPLMTLPPLILLIFALKAGTRVREHKRKGRFLAFSKKAQRIATLALGWMLIYPMINLSINGILTHYEANKMEVNSSQVFLLTEPLSPFIWKKTVEREDSYTVSTILTLSPDKKRRETRFPKPNKELVQALAAQLPLFKTYTDFATLMVQETRASNGVNELPLEEIGEEAVKIYTFKDIRYIAVDGSPARILNKDVTPFVFEVAVDAEGFVTSYRFMDNASKLKTPWTKIHQQLALKSLAGYIIS